MAGGPLVVAAARCAGADRQGYANDLAGHDAMAAVAAAFRAAGGLYLQLAAIYAATQPGVLGAFGLVSESWGLFAQSGDPDDAFCLSAVFARRQTALDRGDGAAGNGASGENKILAGSL